MPNFTYIVYAYAQPKANHATSGFAGFKIVDPLTPAYKIHNTIRLVETEKSGREYVRKVEAGSFNYRKVEAANLVEAVSKARGQGLVHMMPAEAKALFKNELLKPTSGKDEFAEFFDEVSEGLGRIVDAGAKLGRKIADEFKTGLNGPT